MNEWMEQHDCCQCLSATNGGSPFNQPTFRANHIRTMRRQWNIVWLALTFSERTEERPTGTACKMIAPAQHDRVALCVCASWTRPCNWEKWIYQSQFNWFFDSLHAAELIANACVIESEFRWRVASNFRILLNEILHSLASYSCLMLKLSFVCKHIWRDQHSAITAVHNLHTNTKRGRIHQQKKKREKIPRNLSIRWAFVSSEKFIHCNIVHFWDGARTRTD